MESRIVTTRRLVIATSGTQLPTVNSLKERVKGGCEEGVVRAEKARRRHVARRAGSSDGGLPTARIRAAPRKGQTEDLPGGGAKLAGQRALVIGNAIAGGECLHPRRHLRIAIAAHIRVQMVLDLMAQVARQDVEQATPTDIAGAQHLPQVPMGARLAFYLFNGEVMGACREVTAEDNRERPDIADDIGDEIGTRHQRKSQPGRLWHNT